MLCIGFTVAGFKAKKGCPKAQISPMYFSILIGTNNSSYGTPKNGT